MAVWMKDLALSVGWLGAATLASAQAPLVEPMLPASPVPAVSEASPALPKSINADSATPTPSNGPIAGVPATASASVPYFVPPPPPLPFGSGGGGPENAFKDECQPGADAPQIHFNVEYLSWWLTRQPIPILVTAGSFNDAVPAALGQPSTTVLIDNVTSNKPFSGGQFTFGYDVLADRSLTFDVRGFVLENHSATASVSGDGSPGSAAIGRPFYNANRNVNEADPVSLPGIMSGSVRVTQSTLFYGAEANLRYNFWESGLLMSRGTLLFGGRFLSLEESLVVDDNRQDLPGLGQVGNTYTFQDRFATMNRFYGGQVGAEGEWHLGNVVLSLTGKVAIGQTDRETNVGGFTRIVEPNNVVSVSTDRAVLVQPSNVGSFRNKEFSVIPSGEASVGYDFNQHVRFSVGYSFLYWFDVLRPGNQVDPVVNIQSLQPFDQIGPARPAVPLARNDFWAQGLNLSLLFSF